jgi:TatD DNase family protein
VPSSDRLASVPDDSLPGLTDTHCHLDLPAFDADRGEMMERARRAGLVRILIPGLDLPSSRRAADLAHSDPMLRFAPGVHPHESGGFTNRVLDELRILARAPGAVAIGEIGLDYYRNLAPRVQQQEAFRAQLSLARELGLPAIVHIREAEEDALAILSAAGNGLRGVLHAFSGNPLLAERVPEMGFYFGIGGPITYPGSARLREIFRALPRERILLETDAPYLPPEGNRGKRNEPALVLAVARTAAREWNQDAGELVQTARHNANNLFAWE